MKYKVGEKYKRKNIELVDLYLYEEVGDILEIAEIIPTGAIYCVNVTKNSPPRRYLEEELEELSPLEKLL